MRLVRLDAVALEAPLLDPFVIASTRLDAMRNVAVRAVLDDGAIGWGEIGALPPVTAEDQPSAIAAVEALVTGIAVDEVAEWLEERLPTLPGARAGVETAVLDAVARSRGLPLHRAFGGAGAAVHSDITIPLCTPLRAAELASTYRRQGFETLKVKVGVQPAADLERLAAIQAAFPGARVILDANEGWTVEQTLEVVRTFRRAGGNPVLLEQPVARADLEGLGRLARESGVLVAADEACRTPDDARRIASGRFAQVINVKLAKSGVKRGLEIAAVARGAGLQLMIGGMVESRIGMGFAAHLAAGLGGFTFVDLDTPHLLARDPVLGGTPLVGPRWDVGAVPSGHGGRPSYSGAPPLRST